MTTDITILQQFEFHDKDLQNLNFDFIGGTIVLKWQEGEEETDVQTCVFHGVTDVRIDGELIVASNQFGVEIYSADFEQAEDGFNCKFVFIDSTERSSWEMKFNFKRFRLLD